MTTQTIVLVISVLLTTLLAGVFFAYSVSVNGALHRLKDIEYIRAMRAINEVIQNPLFFLSFMGPLVLLPLAAYLVRASHPALELLIAATACFYVTFGITVAGNVPLNDRLAAFAPDTASEGDIAKARASFERPWNRLHTVRTIFSIAAAGLAIAACVSY